MKLKKGDNVKIMSGKDRGKTGMILKAFPEDDRIMIDGLNVFKKRSKPRKQGEKGQIVAVSRPLAASKVMIICPNCKSPTRIGGRMEGSAQGPLLQKVQSNTYNHRPWLKPKKHIRIEKRCAPSSRRS